MSASLRFSPPQYAKNIQTRRLSAATTELMNTYIRDWLVGTDPHPDSAAGYDGAGDPGGGEKRVHGIVWGQVWDSTTTDHEVTIFYSE